MFLNLQNSRYMQYTSAITAACAMAAASMYVTWPSPCLPKLQSNDSPLGRKISDEEGSWISACHLLGIVAGAILSGWIVERFGRKKMLLMSGVIILLPWVLIIFEKRIAFIARSIAGIGVGMVIVGCAIYNGEIAETDIRGKLGTTFVVLKLFGSLIVLSAGPYVSYEQLNIISAIMPIIFLVLFIFMPESPYYLIKIGDKVNAEKNLRTLSSNSAHDRFISGRLNEIQASVQEDMKNKTTLWELFSKTEYRRIIFVITGVKMLQQLCGLEAINSYMQPIIEMTESNISPELSSIIFGIVQIPAALVSSLLVDKAGRRPLLIVSALGCAIALFGEGAYFYVQDVLKEDVPSLSWLPTTGIALFLIMNPVGVRTLPYVLLGELFPTNVKGIAVAATTTFGSSMGFFVAKFFKPLSNAWGECTMFWIFGFICIFGAIFVYYSLPETKGKLFAEIQKILRYEKKEDPERSLLISYV